MLHPFKILILLIDLHFLLSIWVLTFLAQRLVHKGIVLRHSNSRICFDLLAVISEVDYFTEIVFELNYPRLMLQKAVTPQVKFLY
jgi:hypothetical protein